MRLKILLRFWFYIRKYLMRWPTSKAVPGNKIVEQNIFRGHNKDQLKILILCRILRQLKSIFKGVTCLECCPFTSKPHTPPLLATLRHQFVGVLGIADNTHMVSTAAFCWGIMEMLFLFINFLAISCHTKNVDWSLLLKIASYQI